MASAATLITRKSILSGSRTNVLAGWSVFVLFPAILGVLGSATVPAPASCLVVVHSYRLFAVVVGEPECTPRYGDICGVYLC